MDDQILSILTQNVLPMAQQMSRSNLIVPGGDGKKAAGSFPVPQKNAVRGAHFPAKGVGMYDSHPGVEWVLCLSGKAELVLDGAVYEMTEGDLGIIPENISHLERKYDDHHDYHLLWFCCNLRGNGVSLHMSSYCGGNRFQVVRGARIPNCTDVCKLFRRGSEEALTRGAEWDSLLRAIALEVVIYVIRHLKEHGLGFMTPLHQANVVDVAKSFIQARFARQLTLSDISQAVFLSPNYFSSLFRQTAGMTVFDYVRQVRLEEAQRLLTETRLRIGEVAKQTGFPTRSHFVRTFRRHADCLPREFRRRQQKIS